MFAFRARSVNLSPNNTPLSIPSPRIFVFFPPFFFPIIIFYHARIPLVNTRVVYSWKIQRSGLYTLHHDFTVNSVLNSCHPWPRRKKKKKKNFATRAVDEWRGKMGRGGSVWAKQKLHLSVSTQFYE